MSKSPHSRRMTFMISSKAIKPHALYISPNANKPIQKTKVKFE